MLLESLKALQVKSNVLVNLSGAAANNATITLPANPKRRSIFYWLNISGTITFSGTTILLPGSVNQPFGTGIVTYDQLGDFIYSSFTLVAGATATAFLVGETYSEERPLLP